MSLRFTLAFAACLTLASCGGNPFVDSPAPPPGPVVPPGPGAGGVLPLLAGNLESATYDRAAETLSVVITPLSGSTPTSGTPIVFTRAQGLDTNGFQAFTRQDTASNRLVIALFDATAAGTARAGVAGSGQFAQPIWGSTYGTTGPNGAFSRPVDAGSANYSGRYAGILNAGPAVPGPESPFNEPSQLVRTRGDVQLTADFASGAVEGGIGNRSVVETGATLANVFLNIGVINSDGSFGGNVSFRPIGGALPLPPPPIPIFPPSPPPIGTYGGTFAGTGGTSAAGAVEINLGGELLERGAFVVNSCGVPQPFPCP